MKEFDINALEARLRSEARQHLQREVQRSNTVELDIELARFGVGGSDSLTHLEAMLRRERMKARARHAQYDFNRHLALHRLIARIKARSAQPKQG